MRASNGTTGVHRGKRCASDKKLDGPHGGPGGAEVEGCASRTERRTILRSRPLGMQTSYRARISRILASLSRHDCHGSLSLFRSFHSRFPTVCVGFPSRLRSPRLASSFTVSASLPLDVNLSHSRSLRLLLNSLVHRFRDVYVCILSLSLTLCVCVCVCVLAVSDNLADERTRYTRCLPFTIFTRREQPHTRSHLLSRCPFCFLYLSSSWSCFPVTLARTLVIVFLCDPILSLMLSLFFVPP